MIAVGIFALVISRTKHVGIPPTAAYWASAGIFILTFWVYPRGFRLFNTSLDLYAGIAHIFLVFLIGTGLCLLFGIISFSRHLYRRQYRTLWWDIAALWWSVPITAYAAILFLLTA